MINCNTNTITSICEDNNLFFVDYLTLTFDFDSLNSVQLSKLIKGNRSKEFNIALKIQHEIYKKVFLTIKHGRNQDKYLGVLTFNPNTITNQEVHNFVRIKEITKELIEYLSPALISRKPIFNNLKISRIDITKDFKCVYNTHNILFGLLQSDRPYERKKSSYQDSKSNSLETITLGTKSERIIFYDKYKESKHDSKYLNTIRFETRFKAIKLKKKGIRLFTKLDNGTINLLGEEVWSSQSLGNVFTSNNHYVASKLNTLDISNKQKLSYLGYLYAKSIPNFKMPLSSATLSKYRKYDKLLGFTFLTNTNQEVVPHSYYFDLISGTVKSLD